MVNLQQITTIKYWVALLLVCILAASYLFLRPHTQHRFQITFNTSLHGLAVGSDVELSGVQIGSVREIELDKNDVGSVMVVIGVDSAVTLTKQIQAQFIPSDGHAKAYIALTKRGDDKSVLVVSHTKPYSAIPVVSQAPESIGNPLQDISLSLNEMNALMKELLTEENIESLKQLLYSLQQVSNVLALNSDRINRLLVRSDTLSVQLSQLMVNSQHILNQLNSQLLPLSYRVLDEAHGTIQNSRQVVGEVARQPAVIIRGKRDLPKGPGE